MNQGQKLWVWRQFANRSYGYNFWVSRCDFGSATGCPWGEHDTNTWEAPGTRIVYKLIG
jgi:hypothetical protein